jgi:hypothetical protein
MSFDRESLGRLGSGLSKSSAAWVYTTEDPMLAVEAKTLKVKDYIVVLAASNSSQYRVEAVSPNVVITAISSSTNSEIIFQPGHGLSDLNLVWIDSSGLFQKGIADSTDPNFPACANVIGITSEVTPDDFRITYSGLIKGLTGLPSGVPFYLSDSTAGAPTPIPPSSPNVVVAIGTSKSSSEFVVQIHFGLIGA